MLPLPKLLPSLIAAVAAVLSAAAQRPLAQFDGEARAGVTEYRREKPAFPVPTRRLTEYFALGDTLESTPSWHLVRMYEPGTAFQVPIRIETPWSLFGNNLYVRNIPLGITLCRSVEGLAPATVARLADSLQTAPVTLEACTTDNAMNPAQNCACYAIECLLRANGIDPAPFFTWETTVPEEAVVPLLGRLTARGRELRVPKNPRKWAQQTVFAPDAIYVCLDSGGAAIHLFFYRDGRFWSKNGAILPHVSYGSVLSILRHYDKTVTLAEYTFREP